MFEVSESAFHHKLITIAFLSLYCPYLQFHPFFPRASRTLVLSEMEQKEISKQQNGIII